MTRDEAISKWIVPAINNTWNEKRCKEILEALEQESKTGHWIYKEDTLEYECSECRRVIDTHRFENPYIRYPYCHCGARMIEPQESEDKE